MKEVFLKILRYLKELGLYDCPECKNKKCVSFYYEEAFTQKNIYRCSKCKNKYIIL